MGTGCLSQKTDVSPVQGYINPSVCHRIGRLSADGVRVDGAGRSRCRYLLPVIGSADSDGVGVGGRRVGSVQTMSSHRFLTHTVLTRMLSRCRSLDHFTTRLRMPLPRYLRPTSKHLSYNLYNKARYSMTHNTHGNASSLV